MRIVDHIVSKRDGLEMSAEEIRELIQAFTAGTIPDYQMSAWLMAVYFRGMTDRETAALTMAMAQSGETVDLGSIPGIKVDKHSTGGVADTTTLVLAPLVAAAGVPVAKMSGRGLGFTGGTIDKLESIPGFRATLSREEFLRNLRRLRLAITGQTADIAPADGKMYALRDVTGTIESIPLIASSIMSKKIAAGADKIVLDVKVGSGAFMKKQEDAVKLAETMVRIGELVGRETMAVITSMSQPLGWAVGNSLEVEEALDILEGKAGSPELKEVCLVLGAHMLVLAGKAPDTKAARRLLVDALESKRALAKFAEMIAAQGGNPEVIANRALFPRAAFQQPVYLEQEGTIQAIDTARIGYSAMLLGAGREYKGQDIDLGAGLDIRCRVGDRVGPGTPVAVLSANDAAKLEPAAAQIKQAIGLGDRIAAKPPLVLGTVSKNGIEMYI
ncbi:MAG TPA: pyrimidine-nucleoside phosphorylase [Selenomonadales bacterium]|nr:pyrimidine-nucleoside phosphorylase [Selenomonadales bacterium]